MLKKMRCLAVVFCLASIQAKAELAPLAPYGSVYFSGALLYWQSHEEGLGFTNQPSSVFTTTDFTTTSLVGPDFAWKPGFRLTADFGFPCSDWALGLHWICYNGSANNSKTAGQNQGMFPVMSISQNTLVGDWATSANMNWKLRSNILDILAETSLSWGSRFSCVPTLGLRNVWFYQSVHTNYQGGSFNAGTDRVKMKSDFFGIGPRVGLIPWVSLGKGFSLYAGGAVACFYGFFRVKEKEVFVDTEIGSVHKSPNRFRWNGDAAAGFLWEYLFEQNCVRLIFDVGGNYLYFNRQNAFVRSAAIGSSGTDLSLYGVHASLCVQF